MLTIGQNNAIYAKPVGPAFGENAKEEKTKPRQSYLFARVNRLKKDVERSKERLESRLGTQQGTTDKEYDKE